MTPRKIRAQIVLEKVAWIHKILTTRVTDIESVLGEILHWLRSNPEMIDTTL